MEGEIKVGDAVRVLGSDAVAVVSKILKEQNQLVVSLNRFEFTIRNTEVSITNPSDARKSHLGDEQHKPQVHLKIQRPKSQNFPTEMDLHGFLVQDALDWLEVWIDRALLTSHQSLKIIHGKGTGALRTAIRQYLENHKHVRISKPTASFKDEGVTWIDI